SSKDVDARTATIMVMQDITPAIITIPLVMSAVFIPVAFLSGPVGVFYRQFSITLAIAIVISGVNALTLTPALCALMLKNDHGKVKKTNWINSFFDFFNRMYDRVAEKYKNILRVIISRRIITVIILLLFVFGTYGIALFLPSGFIPTEDQGTIYVNVTT